MLAGSLRSIDSLSQQEQHQMLDLMGRYYEKIDRKKFYADLREKDGAIILCDNSGTIQGFSTYLVINTVYSCTKIAALFSGDTIIDKQYWGSPELFVTFGKLLGRLLNDHLGKRCYWFLMTKGIRTYLLLPLYFKMFFPRYDKATPCWEKGLIHHLARIKYAEHYNPETGVIEASADYMKKCIADIPEHRKSNRHVRFFLERNPNFSRGDELACICEIRLESLKKRMAGWTRSDVAGQNPLSHTKQ